MASSDGRLGSSKSASTPPRPSTSYAYILFFFFVALLSPPFSLPFSSSESTSTIPCSSMPALISPASLDASRANSGLRHTSALSSRARSSAPAAYMFTGMLYPYFCGSSEGR